ncbi:MAG: hypothetical protein OXI26_01765 [bacterium]|nr:hypothetical protein [bacterium]
MTLVAIIATACGGDSPASAVESPAPPAATGLDSGPVVEVASATATLPPLDPSADPRTPLGELRARYLPVWTSEFDWAFPPEVCGSDWPLDAIAEPTSAAGAAVLEDPVVAMALSVMRYEHLVSRSMAEPDVLEQLCVAVATVGSARAETLDILASRLLRIGPTPDPAPDASSYPDEVTIVAAGLTRAVAVACAIPGPRAGLVDGGLSEADPGGSRRLGAYFLVVSRGVEDSVVDISFRVSEMTAAPADGCAELEAWADRWSQRAREWADAGDIWTVVDRTVTVEEICDVPRADGPSDCPLDWSPRGDR